MRPMCGFVGIFNRNNQPVDVSVVRRMADAQWHRGPDDQAFGVFSLKKGRFLRYADDETPIANEAFSGAVGFNRLSILDTSIRGRQPMSTMDGRQHIVFNGEIYNSPELREELRGRGFEFHSDTDTEVILYLYQALGAEGMLRRLNGMFALCIIDLAEQSLFLARDRLGIKPLYVTNIGPTLLFASEVKSFLQHPEFELEIDQQRMDEYLLFRYVSGGRSLVRGVEQIKPGCWYRVGLTSQSSGEFWELPAGPADGRSFRENLNEFENQLRQSVEQQLLSDVKLGCQLSGGIDSSLINRFAAQSVGSRLDAFSVIFDDPLYTEEHWIDQSAKIAGVSVNKYRLDASWFADNIDRATWHLDQPLNHPNTLGILFLADNARSMVTVLLSGEGADELLGGYSRFFYAHFANERQRLAGVLGGLPIVGSFFSSKLGLGRRDEIDRFVMASTFAGPNDAEQLYADFSLDRALDDRRQLFASTPGRTYLQKCLNYSMQTYLQELLLRQDKMTMAASMENRVPFLDHRLVEFVRNLPDRHLVTLSLLPRRDVVERNTKVILKKLARREFGGKFAYRKKSGFALPLREFFALPSFRERVADSLLPDAKRRGLFNGRFLQNVWNRIDSGSAAQLDLFWIAMAFELWVGQFGEAGRRSRPGASAACGR